MRYSCGQDFFLYHSRVSELKELDLQTIWASVLHDTFSASPYECWLSWISLKPYCIKSCLSASCACSYIPYTSLHKLGPGLRIMLNAATQWSQWSENGKAKLTSTLRPTTSGKQHGKQLLPHYMLSGRWLPMYGYVCTVLYWEETQNFFINFLWYDHGPSFNGISGQVSFWQPGCTHLLETLWSWLHRHCIKYTPSELKS